MKDHNEAAIQYDNFLVRIDVLKKDGKHLDLIEVKAKSIDPGVENVFYDKRKLRSGQKVLVGDWEPYLFDVAFQVYVARKAFPDLEVHGALMLADKSTQATVDHLNQRFFLGQENRRTCVSVAPGTDKESVGKEILVRMPVDEQIELILNGSYEGRTFDEHVQWLAKAYLGNERIFPEPGSKCKTCEFRIGQEALDKGQKSGFEECWTSAFSLSKKDLQRPLVIDVWNYRRSDEVIEDGRYFMDEMTEEDVPESKTKPDTGLCPSERQWEQIRRVIEKDRSPYFDQEDLNKELQTLKYPLHFIDFETTRAAIPFHKGMRPYEQIAFQFSHHTLTVDGKVEHQDQYLNRERGKFPNFDFVRALKKTLSNDEGTVFRYHNHENTVLCEIYAQLQESNEPDRKELMSWIRTIARPTDKMEDRWDDPGRMVDLWDWVKRFYYHPLTEGSISIKHVLPAILQESTYLQELYGNATYGSANGIKSLNFRNWQWIEKGPDGKINDPYKHLPPAFDGLDRNLLDSFLTEGDIDDGGAAMMAYARMQFTQMTDLERNRVCEALLKYCELDTLGMVMIFQYWNHEISKGFKRAKVA